MVHQYLSLQMWGVSSSMSAWQEEPRGMAVRKRPHHPWEMLSVSQSVSLSVRRSVRQSASQSMCSLRLERTPGSVTVLNLPLSQASGEWEPASACVSATAGLTLHTVTGKYIKKRGKERETAQAQAREIRLADLWLIDWGKMQSKIQCRPIKSGTLGAF